ncbi:MAG: transglycosylase domain-containing protein, partial [Bacteroidales bacterium]|nr:transglycosylase domain-containing protein [Bacteroidales bacterium]
MPKFIRIFLKIIRNILLFFFISSILAVVAYRWLPVYYTPLMFIRVMQNMSEGKPARFHHTWIPITQMPEHLPLAVMSSEDQFFLQHNGFDIEGIKKAAAERLMG